MKFKAALCSTTIMLGALTLSACSGSATGGSLSVISIGPTSLNGTPLQGVSSGMPSPFTPTAGVPVSGETYVTAILTPISVDAKNNYKVVKGMSRIEMAVVAGRMTTGGAYVSANGLTYALQASTGTMNALQPDGIEGMRRTVHYTIYQDGGAAGAPQGPVRIDDTLVLPTHTGAGKALRDNQAVELNGCYYLLTVAAQTPGTHILQMGGTSIGGMPAFPDEVGGPSALH